jgi:hypothetical protein
LLDAERHVGSAIAEGWNAPAFLTPEAKARAEADNQQTWVGRNIVSPLVAASELPFRAMNATAAGIGQAAYEVGNAVGGPSLGRDLYMGQQVAPAAAMPGFQHPLLPGTPKNQFLRPPGPAQTAERYPEQLMLPAPELPPAAPPAAPPPEAIPMPAPQSYWERLYAEGRAPAPGFEAQVTMRDPGAAPPASEPPSAANQPPPASSPAPRPTVPRQVESQPAAAAVQEPQPAGAQITPASELGMSPKEEAAYRATAEGNKLLETQTPGVRDDKPYLQGATANEAETSQDVQVARELKSLRQQTPELDAKMTADETHNQNVVTNHIHDALPGRVQIQAAEAARSDAMKANEPKVFRNATDADVQPIVQSIQDTLNDPKNRQNSQMQQYVRPLIDRLQNEDGTPKITDPKELWGLRQDVQHLTSKAAQAGDPNLSRVSGVLGSVLDAIDNQIETAASGYKTQLRDEYRTRSQQIDAMKALDDERFKLFDSQNKPNYNSVQRLMRRIVDGRQEGDPYNPYANVPPETLDKLWNVRDFMRRQVAADRLAAPKGSPTAQNFGDAMRAAGRMAAQNAAPAIGATLGAAFIPIPGVGPALGLGAGAAVNHFFSERAMAQRVARGLELTNPNRLLHQPAP